MLLMKLKVNYDVLLSWDIEDYTHIIVSSALLSHNPTSSILVPPIGPKFSELLQLAQNMGQKLDIVLAIVNSLSQTQSNPYQIR